MEDIKIWIRRNGIPSMLIAVAVVLFGSPDAKAWVMRQLMSTGVLKTKITEIPAGKKGGESDFPSASVFAVRDAKGNILTTTNLKGKVVFINFWASWYPPCRAEFPSVEKLYQKFGKNPEFEFLMVNMDDDPKAGKEFLQKNGYSVPFMVPDGQVPADYFQGSLPTTIVLDKKGQIRLSHTGMADYSVNSFYQQMEELVKEN